MRIFKYNVYITILSTEKNLHIESLPILTTEIPANSILGIYA